MNIWFLAAKVVSVRLNQNNELKGVQLLSTANISICHPPHKDGNYICEYSGIIYKCHHHMLCLSSDDISVRNWSKHSSPIVYTCEIMSIIRLHCLRKVLLEFFEAEQTIPGTFGFGLSDIKVTLLRWKNWPEQWSDRLVIPSSRWQKHALNLWVRCSQWFLPASFTS